MESKPLLNNEEMEVMFKMLENPVTEKGFVTGKKINDSLMAMGVMDLFSSHKSLLCHWILQHLEH